MDMTFEEWVNGLIEHNKKEPLPSTLEEINAEIDAAREDMKNGKGIKVFHEYQN